jgi:hypothetical protein
MCCCVAEGKGGQASSGGGKARCAESMKSTRESDVSCSRIQVTAFSFLSLPLYLCTRHIGVHSVHQSILFLPSKNPQQKLNNKHECSVHLAAVMPRRLCGLRHPHVPRYACCFCPSPQHADAVHQHPEPQLAAAVHGFPLNHCQLQNSQPRNKTREQ